MNPKYNNLKTNITSWKRNALWAYPYYFLNFSYVPLLPISFSFFVTQFLFALFLYFCTLFQFLTPCVLLFDVSRWKLVHFPRWHKCWTFSWFPIYGFWCRDCLRRNYPCGTPPSLDSSIISPVMHSSTLFAL